MFVWRFRSLPGKTGLWMHSEESPSSQGQYRCRGQFHTTNVCNNRNWRTQRPLQVWNDNPLLINYDSSKNHFTRSGDIIYRSQTQKLRLRCRVFWNGCWPSIPAILNALQKDSRSYSSQDWYSHRTQILQTELNILDLIIFWNSENFICKIDVH